MVAEDGTPTGDGPEQTCSDQTGIEPDESAPGASRAGEQRTIRLDLEFDGTDFEGWQRQSSGRTVQAEVESALERILGEPHPVVGCGRTDSGVHARQLVASFRTTHGMSVEDMGRALDAVLPPDVGVPASFEADADFHARRDALWKWYRYTILVSRRSRPLLRRTTLRLASVPPLERLQAAAAPLVGRHDFRSFANTGSTPGHTTRTLHALEWSRTDDELRFDVVGDGFLYKMVRTLVGTLLQAARLEDPPAAARRILAARAREAAGPAVPAVGLCLMAVAVRGESNWPRLPRSLLRSVESGSQSARGGKI